MMLGAASSGDVFAAANDSVQDIAVARLLADGGRDPAFATGGLVRLPRYTGAGVDTLTGIAIDSKQRVLVTATASVNRAMILRIAQGVIDNGFGNGGWTFVAQGTAAGGVAADEADAVITAFVLGGVLHLARLASSGFPDQTFGVDGARSTGIVADRPSRVVLSPERILTLAVTTSDPPAAKVVRYWR
jgi:hypothetical protein